MLTLKGGTVKKKLNQKQNLPRPIQRCCRDFCLYSKGILLFFDDLDFDEEVALKYCKEMEDMQELKRKKEQAFEDQNTKKVITYQTVQNKTLNALGKED